MEQTIAGVRRIEQADLRTRNTFAVAARAPLLLEVVDVDALPDVFARGWAGAGSMVLGSGSNLLFAGDPGQPLLALTGQRTNIVHDDGDTATVRAEAGVAWHRFVQWTLAHRLSGLENLALIPGTVGAAPIQNIGAYGSEVRERIAAVEAWDCTAGAAVRLDNAACGFGYRDSAFKRQPNRWIVTAVEFALPRRAAVRVDYAGVAEELLAMGITNPAPTDVAAAVVRLRRRKLPDPALVGNAGSFFKNPVVPAGLAESLRREHPELPVYAAGDEQARKLSAAWLIDRCGWKGHREGDAGVSERHALVLVNHGAASGAQLLELARRIAQSVEVRFGVAIEPEPRIVGARW